jgi:hypothetical protein
MNLFTNPSGIVELPPSTTISGNSLDLMSSQFTYRDSASGTPVVIIYNNGQFYLNNKDGNNSFSVSNGFLNVYNGNNGNPSFQSFNYGGFQSKDSNGSGYTIFEASNAGYITGRDSNNNQAFNLSNNNHVFNGLSSSGVSYYLLQANPGNILFTAIKPDQLNTYSLLQINDGQIQLNGLDASNNSQNRMQISNGTFNTYYSHPSGSTNSIISVSPGSFQFNHISNLGNAYNLISVTNTQTQFLGANDNGNYNRLSLADTTCTIAGFDASGSQYDMITKTDSRFTANGHVAGYGNYSLIDSDNGDFSATRYDAGYGTTETIRANNGQLTIREYITGYGSNTTFQADNIGNLSLTKYISGYGTVNVFNVSDSALEYKQYDNVASGSTSIIYAENGSFQLNGREPGSGSAYAVVSMNSGTTTISSTNTVTKNILPDSSGTRTLGTQALPFSGAHIQVLNNYTVVVGKYNETPLGAINNVNNTFALTFNPVDNSLQLFKNGIYMIQSGVGAPTFDYQLVSGNTIIYTSAPLSGSVHICNYNFLG